MMLATVPTTLAILALILGFAAVRLLFLLPPHRPKPRRRSRDEAVRVLVVLGSGGHTAEMLAMLAKVDMSRFAHRTYVVSSGDAFSADKARTFEEGTVKGATERRQNEGQEQTVDVSRSTGVADDAPLTSPRIGKERVMHERKSHGVGGTCTKAGGSLAYAASAYTIHTLPRARRVHQPLYTAPYTSFKTLVTCLVLLASRPYPDVIITNGPGTGVVVVLASVMLRFFNIRGASSSGSMRTMYIESWARVKRLSLSGRLLVRVVDRFLVQWDSLEGVDGRGEYHGVLI